MSGVRLQALRGRRVCVALADGNRLDDCRLLSAGRSSTDTVWFVSDGVDVFVRRDALMAVWEAA